jgi:hypothetical protein
VTASRAMPRQKLAALCFFTLAAATATELQSQKRLVGTLRDQRAVQGCSWAASSADVGSGFVFLAERDDSLIVMNIDGMDVRLALDPRSGTGLLSRVGDRLTKVYTAGSVRVHATYTATWTCPNVEGCEVTRFDVTFVVERGSETETVEGIGEVGC